MLSDTDRSNLEKESRTPIGLIIAGVIAAVALVFILQNTESVRVNFLFIDAEAPLYVVIVISMVLGALLGWIGLIIWRRRKRDDRR